MLAAGEGVAAAGLGGGHDGGEGEREVEYGGVADARRRGVLAGEDGARVHRLALGVDEGVELRSGLRRGEPLQR